jgi:superfamily I DNA and/or RNA helicase
VDEDDLDASTEESSLSILEYCESKGLYKVMLDKNYRSQSSAIMSFSSKNFYKSSLEVIDNFNNDVKKPLEVIHVSGVREGSNKINKKEIEKVIEVLEKNIKKFNSILVVCFNLLHKYEVEKRLASGKYPSLDSALYEKKISVKNIENVQGDEAELVIMNVVMDPNTRISSTYVCRPGGKNALNVAVSRAIKKLVVVKSIKNQDIPNTHSNENTEVFKE